MRDLAPVVVEPESISPETFSTMRILPMLERGSTRPEPQGAMADDCLLP